MTRPSRAHTVPTACTSCGLTWRPTAHVRGHRGPEWDGLCQPCYRRAIDRERIRPARAAVARVRVRSADRNAPVIPICPPSLPLDAIPDEPAYHRCPNCGSRWCAAQGAVLKPRALPGLDELCGSCYAVRWRLHQRETAPRHRACPSCGRQWTPSASPWRQSREVAVPNGAELCQRCYSVALRKLRATRPLA